MDEVKPLKADTVCAVPLRFPHADRVAGRSVPVGVGGAGLANSVDQVQAHSADAADSAPNIVGRAGLADSVNQVKVSFTDATLPVPEGILAAREAARAAWVETIDAGAGRSVPS